MKTNILQIRCILLAPAAILLLLSAALKTNHQFSTPLPDSLFLESPTLTQFLAAAEVLLDVWLLSGWQASIARKVAIIAFAAFSLVSFGKWLGGANSCGCFGGVRVPPGITTVLDLVVIATLAAWRPEQVEPNKNRLAFWSGTAITGVLATLLIPLAAPDYVENTIGQTTADGSTIVMMPNKWNGSPLPIAKYISGDNRYLKGQWQMVLYHEDCDKCQRLIADMTSTPQPIPVVMVEVPPHQTTPRHDNEQFQWRKLSDQKNWFVSAPVVLDLRDGIVTRVADE